MSAVTVRFNRPRWREAHAAGMSRRQSTSRGGSAAASTIRRVSISAMAQRAAHADACMGKEAVVREGGIRDI